MKFLRIIIFAGGILFIATGCISSPPQLAPVGPDATSPAFPKPNGYLQVFSATDTSVPFASDDPAVFNLHSGYDIYDAAGHCVKFVANHDSSMDEFPDEVLLPPGLYSIVAESTCCGLVTVPAVIERGKVTNIHLDGNWWPPSNTSSNLLVSLPNGAPVGWSGLPAK